MKAVVQDRYGPPEVLHLAEVPRPSPGPDEVLVRVLASSMHADIWHAVVGRPLPMRFMGAGLRRPSPQIPGTDVAGVVEEVGEGVEELEPGQEVFGSTVRRIEWVHGAAYAEYAVAPARQLAPKPAGVGFAEAACVPTSGHVALQNLRDEARTSAGSRVLVNGAAGAVGAIALQVAKARGARVTGVDGPGKQDLMRRLGADEVLDYTEEDFTTHAGRYDLVFDVPGNHPYSRCRRALKQDGRYVPIGHEDYGRRAGYVLGVFPEFFGMMIRARFDERLRGPGSPPPNRPTTLATLRSMLVEGTLTPRVDRVWPLAQAAAALRHLMSGSAVGRIVIAPDPHLAVAPADGGR